MHNVVWGCAECIMLFGNFFRFKKIIALVTGNRARKWRENKQRNTGSFKTKLSVVFFFVKFQKSFIHILSCTWALAHGVTILVYNKQYLITTRAHLLDRKYIRSLRSARPTRCSNYGQIRKRNYYTNIDACSQKEPNY